MARTRRKSSSRAPARRPSRRRTGPGPAARAREAVGRELGGHRRDAAAIASLAVGVLLALGLAGDLAGPLGRAVDRAVTALVGRAAFLAPVAFVALGVALLAASVRGDRSEEHEEREPAAVRIGLGAALIAVSVAGLLHLGYGRPALSGPLGELRDAGGLFGAAIGQPLVAALGAVGAAVVLVASGLVGALLVPGIPLHRVVAALGGATRAAGRALAALFAMPPAEASGPGAEGDAEATLLGLTDDDAGPLGMVGGTGDEPDDPGEALDDVEGAGDLDADDGEAGDEAAARGGGRRRAEVPAVEGDGGQLAIDLTARATGPWKLPPASVLARSSDRRLDSRLVQAGGRVLEQTLREFGVDARLVGMTVGPTVTRYELELAPGVKVNRVTSLGHDIAYAMASPDVRILAPIPGRSAIGVEVPNKQRQLVTLGDILESPEAQRATHPLEVGLGRDISGRALTVNLSTFPHVLIAGATGAGKSSCINSIVTSLLMRATPDQVRLILIDPKRVELGGYNGLPHLLTEVVTNPKRAANALDWAVREMEMRYELLAEVGVRDITGFNAMHDRGELPTAEEPDPVSGVSYQRLPYIVIVVDELNDLMMVAARDVEASICRIAQMARAVGIHLVIATQRPSVNVITGVIKANVPSRLAFSVSSLADSRVILDQPGAEKLIGQGDMLMLTASSNRTQRVQGSWVEEACVRKVVAHWKRQVTEPNYVEGVAGDDSADGAADRAGGPADDTDDLLDEAMELVVRSGLGSTSMLQRKLRVGFSRAGRIMDLLERRGVVGPSEGSKARAVLMTVEELEESRAHA